MDNFDVKILSYLQNEGRASYQEVGDAVGLSLSACHKRVKALEQSGVIERYAAIVSEDQTGFRTSTYIQVRLHDQKQGTLDAFEAQVIQHPEIMDCVLMAGDWDYLVRILCRGVEDYERIHHDILTALPGVERVNSSFALRTICRRTAIPMSIIAQGFPKAR